VDGAVAVAVLPGDRAVDPDDSSGRLAGNSTCLMTSYLVRGRPKPGKLVKLRRKLELGDIALMRGFGKSLEFGLKNAKLSDTGEVLWEQPSSSTPILSQEKKAILSEFFREIFAEEVAEGQGWEKIRRLQSLWAAREFD